MTGGEYDGRQLSSDEVAELERTLAPHLLADLVVEAEIAGERLRVRPYRFAPAAADFDLSDDGHLTITD